MLSQQSWGWAGFAGGFCCHLLPVRPLALGPGEKCLVYFVSKAVFVYLQLFSNIYVDVNN